MHTTSFEHNSGPTDPHALGGSRFCVLSRVSFTSTYCCSVARDAKPQVLGSDLRSQENRACLSKVMPSLTVSGGDLGRQGA